MTIVRLAVVCLVAFFASMASIAHADRAPVLGQIDVPHDYYYREMYLPQLTSGPSAVAFMPDGERLVYSMQGSLWLQSIDSDIATQLTAGPGYDFQPDVAPDGSAVVFTRYLDDALNLFRLDVDSGDVTALTSGNDVNVEPRWSPDGTRLAFVSTRGTGRFHVFIGSVGEASFESAPLLPERRSDTSRYYYSAYDHELSPTWSPDGREIIYLSNPEIIYGSGAIWRRALDGGDTIPIRVEETTWRARPDWSPDGQRVVYSSYLGRQWHQLWLTTAAGNGDPIPLSYGDFDITNARWSPDGRRIAYIANEGGRLGIRIQEFVGGKVRELAIAERRYLRPTGTLALRIADAQGRLVAGRVSVSAADGRRYAPDDAWMHADDGFDRERTAMETQYFHSDGAARISLPAGDATVRIWRGLESRIASTTIEIVAGETTPLGLNLDSLKMPGTWQRQLSGDVHVHMNYGGHYRNTPEHLVRQAASEDLDVVFNLIVNKEQRIPDIHYFSARPDAASTDRVLLLHGQEYHTSYWGHLGLLGLDDHFLLPDYSAYPNTGAASPYPDNATIAGLAHEQSALVGYVHPFLTEPEPASESITNALPVDAALGLADFYEVVGFADHRASAAVWYRLLNCGMHLAAAGGTDAMANFASLRGPVGLNRTYARIDGDPETPEERKAAWLAALAAGRTLATNGPLLGLTVDDHEPGQTVSLDKAGRQLRYRGFLRSIVPVDHVELVQNGKVAKRFETDASGMSADIGGTLTVDEDGWLLLRAWNDQASPDIFDLYPYATTNPVFFDIDGKDLRCGADADYFIAWIDRIRDSAAAHPDYATDEERSIVLSNLDEARAVFEGRR